jgi:hypothetical protein
MLAERSITLRSRPVGILPANFARCAAGGLLGLLIAVALMIVARRAAGALENTLAPTTLALTGVLVAAAAVAIRLGWFSSPTAHRGPFDWVVMLLTSLSVAALGAGLCLSGSPALGMFLLCTLLLAEESWAWAWHIRHSFEPTTPNPQRTMRLDAAHAATPRAGRKSPIAHAVLPFDPETVVFPDEISQQLTRSQAADGAEELSGWLRMPFAAGQRTGSMHVAFCPPFSAAPELAVEQIGGPDVRIKTAQLMPYGARLDLKLAAAAEEPTAVLLQFSARTPGHRPAD